MGGYNAAELAEILRMPKMVLILLSCSVLAAPAIAADEARCDVPGQPGIETVGDFNRANREQLGTPGQNRGIELGGEHIDLTPSQFAQLRNFTRKTFCPPN